MVPHVLLLWRVASWGVQEVPQRTKGSVVREQTIKAVKAGHFRRKQDDDRTISTKATVSTSRKNTPKKGAVFAEVENDDDDDQDEEEGLPLPSYKEYLRENRIISLNVGETNRVFEEDCVSEFGIGCVQVNDTIRPATTNGVVFADSGK